MPRPYDPDHARVVAVDDCTASEVSADAFLGERRWESCQIVLAVEQAAALLAGRTLAVDVREEYVALLSVEPAQHRAP